MLDLFSGRTDIPAPPEDVIMRNKLIRAKYDAGDAATSKAIVGSSVFSTKQVTI